MRSRRGLAALALAIVVVAIAIWFATRGSDRASNKVQTSTRSSASDVFAQRLAAIRKASQALAPALPRYALRGRVLDSAGSPVPGASVVLGDMQTKTGAAGEFVLTGLVPGRYSVEARKGPLVGGPFAVQLAGDREVTLVLRRGAELRVEVVSAEGGKPIANADVRISLLSMYDRGGEQTGRTDATGVATFAGVTLVAHDIWVGADGFLEQTDTVDPMHVDGTALRFRMALTPGVSVRGRVVDAESGEPIAGAAIEAFKGDHREAARRGDDRTRHGNAPPYAMEVRGMGTRSDAEGRFRVGVTKGPWTITARHARYATMGVFTAVTDSPLEVQLSMTKGVVMRGVVVDERDAPVPGAEVEARWQHGGRVERTTRADGRGHFELAGLPAAPMEILARADHGTSVPKRFDLAQPLADEDVLLVLANTGAITGRVVRGRDPVAFAQVFFVESAPRPHVHPAVVNTDESGAFRITGLARDRVYALTAMPHQDGDAWFRSGGVEAKVGSDVTIEIPADGKIRGRVDAKLGDVRVEIEGNTPPRTATKFVFEGVPPGQRILLFTGSRIAEKRVTVELAPGQDLDLGLVQLATGRVLAGKVIDANKAPVPDADIVVTAQAAEVTGRTRPGGVFSLVAPADQELVVEARGRRGGYARVELAAKAPSSELVLQFTGSATLEGAITLGDDALGDVIVQLRKPGAAADRPYSYTETDNAGYFRLVALEPGAYELHITRTDPDTAKPIEYMRPFELKAGANYANTDLKTLTPR